MLARKTQSSALVLLAVAVGCSQERPPINRVQAQALDKTFFVGANVASPTDGPEFYMRGTVVDVGYGAAQDGLFTATYAQPTSRIRWEITENYLNARLAYERIQGSDGKGLTHDGWVKKQNNDGQIVASYKISSHFDIQRSYNSGTGEQLNVVEENTSDRVWNQRQYMRVDWSQNVATGGYDYDTLSMMGAFGGITYSPLAYTVVDPSDPNAPHFDTAGGYFDVTNKVFAEPQTVDLSAWGYGKLPACWFSGESAYANCNSTELTLRQSFRKVTDTDYEPADVDGVRFQAFGNFTTEYRGYDRTYGMVDDKWFRFADRYNIWDRSHFYSDPTSMTGEIQCDTVKTTVAAKNDPMADPNRDDNKNGTADECEQAGAGSQCDVFKGRCTLPYAQRKALTIPWYINGGTTAQVEGLLRQLAAAPDASTAATIQQQIDAAQARGEDLFQATDWAVQEWDLAMKTAVQSSRLVECRKTNGGNCDNKFPMWRGQQDDNEEAVNISRLVNDCRRKNGWSNASCDQQAIAVATDLAKARGNANDLATLAIGKVVAMPSVVVLCHNPVINGDHSACGAPGLSPRLGDLRYHQVHAIDKPQAPSAWGIMVDADDPITGEKVAASINIWTHITDMAAQQMVDMVRYINGELTTADITEGKYVRDWAHAQRVGSGAAGAPTMTREEVEKRIAAAAGIEAKELHALAKSKVPDFVQKAMAIGDAKARDVMARNDVASPQQARVQARLAAAQATQEEAELLNPAMLQLAGIDGKTPVTAATSSLASPLGMNNAMMRAQIHRMRENALAARGACIVNEAPEPTSMTGLADILKAKFPPAANETKLQQELRYERMARFIKRRYQYAVIAHEMGHSIGLRHNFVTSAASLHYRPQYWQLRTKNGSVTQECTNAVNQADAANCVGPRYFDPMTDEEQSQLIWMFMQSSVMDYPGDTSQDMIGLGSYDFAAARFFYGDVTSVYNVTPADLTNSSAPAPSDYLADGPIGLGIHAATDDFGGMTGVRYGVGQASQSGAMSVGYFHYSQLQTNWNVIDRCYAVKAAAPNYWNKDVDGIWNQVLDGGIVNVDGVAKKCRQLPVDYVAYNDLAVDKQGRGRGGPNVDAKKRLRVPYSFATDHWADTGNVSVFRHDNGADPFEQVSFLINTQENRHIFDNYRRGRSTFTAAAAADRSFERYNLKLLGMSGGLGFYGTIYQDLATNQGLSFEALWPFVVSDLQPNVIAASVAFDHFSRELSRPQPGPHYYRDAKLNDPVLHSDSDADDYGAGTNFLPNINTGAMCSVPNGATGYLRDVGFGGHPLENGLSNSYGDYSTDYLMNAGSYYDKINTAILLSYSEDRFISASRRDFYDARFRAVGMADVFPEGYRRLLANALTGDRSMLAPRMAAEAGDATTNGFPKPTLDAQATGVDAQQYPSRPIGWVSWWSAAGPQVCFPADGETMCNDYYGDTFNPGSTAAPAKTAYVDPQIGWEVQKYLIAYSMAFIPANERTGWSEMLRLWKLGKDSDPGFESRIEWQDPESGEVYYARTYGKECLFGDTSSTTKSACAASNGKWVQKGIAARVLEYANQLAVGGYQLDTKHFAAMGDYPAGFNKYGRAMLALQPNGNAIVAPDPTVRTVTPDGMSFADYTACDQNVTPSCTPLTILANHSARELAGYKSVPDFMRRMGIRYGYFGLSSPRGE